MTQNLNLIENLDEICGSSEEQFNDRLIENAWAGCEEAIKDIANDIYSKYMYREFNIIDLYAANKKRAFCKNIAKNIVYKAFEQHFNASIEGLAIDEKFKKIINNITNNIYAKTQHITKYEAHKLMLSDINYIDITSSGSTRCSSYNKTLKLVKSGSNAWLYSFNTCIAYRYNNIIYINETFMSSYTSQHLSGLKYEAVKQGFTVYSVRGSLYGMTNEYDDIQDFFDIFKKNIEAINNNKCIRIIDQVETKIKGSTEKEIDKYEAIFRVYHNLSDIELYGYRNYTKYIKKNNINNIVNIIKKEREKYWWE